MPTGEVDELAHAQALTTLHRDRVSCRVVVEIEMLLFISGFKKMGYYLRANNFCIFSRSSASIRGYS
ncbi:Hypothetical protein NTJ_14662 [Nesidiocoris tenuis]|uniref:Uncharacterized protein n=1 Tax=Nesidiocoris tenuis TaxID=355587 RepID=A0ABN7BC67_9HEMI|nr:Hypothetical protein NTJ_14662 [Nesidiocoris tenuis]